LNYKKDPATQSYNIALSLVKPEKDGNESLLAVTMIALILFVGIFTYYLTKHRSKRIAKQRSIYRELERNIKL